MSIDSERNPYYERAASRNRSLFLFHFSADASFSAHRHQADKSRDGAEDRAFKTPLQAVLLTSRGEACFRMFLSRTKASNRYLIKFAALPARGLVPFGR